MDAVQVGNEIEKARKNAGYTQQTFADALGINLRNYQHIASGRFPVNKTATIKNIDLLLQSNFYDKIYDKSKDPNLPIIVSEPIESYQRTRLSKKNTHKQFMVPLVPVAAQAGYKKSYRDSDFLNKLEEYPNAPPAKRPP